jgi:hypothetical protein
MSEQFQSPYQDLTDLQHVAEPLPEPTESDDYTEDEVLAPGMYLSESREIKGGPSKRKDGNYTFEITFTTGLENGDGRKKGYFERTYASTKPFSRPNRPGKTSQVAEYLREFGFKPKGLKIEEIIDFMAQSQTMPVQVRVGRTNATKRISAGDPANGIPAVYEDEVLRTRDFNVGTKEEPNYVLTVTKDGVTYTAKHKFEGWRRA